MNAAASLTHSEIESQIEPLLEAQLLCGTPRSGALYY
jgi:hypothetical protein